MVVGVLAMLVSSTLCLTEASPAQCNAGDRSTCIHESGPRAGGAMIQKPAEPVNLALAQTPLKSKLENLQADVESLTKRVTALQGLAGVTAAEPAALQAVGARVGQLDHATGKLSSIRAPIGHVLVEQPHRKLGLLGKPYVKAKHENFDEIVKNTKRKFPVLMEVDNDADDDGTLKAIIEELEAKIETLKSNVLNLENIVMGTNSVTPVAAKLEGNETTSSLASRATIIELNVASLRTNVASLETAMTGDVTAK